MFLGQDPIENIQISVLTSTLGISQCLQRVRLLCLLRKYIISWMWDKWRAILDPCLVKSGLCSQGISLPKDMIIDFARGCEQHGLRCQCEVSSG